MMSVRSWSSAVLLVLSLSAAVLVGDSPANQNKGGPPVEKRNFTDAEIEGTLRALGVAPNSESSPITCDITDSSGGVTNQVTPAAYPGGPFYWLHYNSNGVSANQVQLTVAPLFSGSPLAAQTQVFSPYSDSSIETPFGIPFWGENLTSGPWVLVVRNDSNQSAACRFVVVP
ncbi:MAG TPA: hypothetical protein VI455_14940 [Terriglobia bacterium]